MESQLAIIISIENNFLFYKKNTLIYLRLYNPKNRGYNRTSVVSGHCYAHAIKTSLTRVVTLTLCGQAVSATLAITEQFVFDIIICNLGTNLIFIHNFISTYR